MGWFGKLLVGFLIIVGLLVVGTFFYTLFFPEEEELTVGSSAKLECTTECAERGQCGTLISKVILGGIDAPIVEKDRHDRYIPAGAEVEIKDKRSEVLLPIDGGKQFDQSFSRVEWRNPAGDIQKTGWIADWCIRAN